MKALYLSFICLLTLFSSVALSATIAQNHQVKGLNCEGCHTTMPMADYSKCIACHGGKERRCYGLLFCDQRRWQNGQQDITFGYFLIGSRAIV